MDRQWLAAALRARAHAWAGSGGVSTELATLGERVLHAVDAALREALPAVGEPSASAEGGGERASEAPPYHRMALLCEAGVEVLLMRWRPQGVSAIHDHGGGHGTVFVLQGELEERRWADEGDVRAGRPPTSRRFLSSSSFEVSERHFHDMCCLSDGALTLHVYREVSGPMCLADPQGRATLLVSPGHGAWMPAAKALLERRPWR